MTWVGSASDPPGTTATCLATSAGAALVLPPAGREPHLYLVDRVLDQHAVREPHFLLKVVLDALNQQVLGLRRRRHAHAKASVGCLLAQFNPTPCRPRRRLPRTACSLGGGCSFIFSSTDLKHLIALPMEMERGRQATCSRRGGTQGGGVHAGSSAAAPPPPPPPQQQQQRRMPDCGGSGEARPPSPPTRKLMMLLRAGENSLANSRPGGALNSCSQAGR